MPAWLGARMTRLGAVMSQAIVHHYGRDELLRRLAHPFWFQSFGAVMGMDWHSGITTSVIGALKRGLKPLEKELGIHCVRGGRGRHSRLTPQELEAAGERAGLRPRRPREGEPPRRQADSAAGRLQPMDGRSSPAPTSPMGGRAAGHERRP